MTDTTLDHTLPAPAKPENNVYFPALDGVRGFAFLLVFFTHYANLPWGSSGVDLFFVLSGFLITGILYDTRNARYRVRNFYIRRTLRIFPLFYGICMAIVLLYPVFHWQWDWTWLVWPLYVGNYAWLAHPMTVDSHAWALANGQLFSRTFTHATLFIGPFWSLCVEEQFYLAWPWVVFLVRDRSRLLAICLGCIVLCPLLRLLLPYALPSIFSPGNISYLTPFRVDALLLGGAIALLQRHPPSWQPVLRAARVLFWICAVLIVGWVILHPPVRHSTLSYPQPAWATLSVDFMSASIIVLSLTSGSLLHRIFNLGALRWLGRISYGAYIFHDMFHGQYLWLAGRLTHSASGPVTAFLALGCTVLLAYTSFRWFESPFIRMKGRLTRADA